MPRQGYRPSGEVVDTVYPQLVKIYTGILRRFSLAYRQGLADRFGRWWFMQKEYTSTKAFANGMGLPYSTVERVINWSSSMRRHKSLPEEPILEAICEKAGLAILSSEQKNDAKRRYFMIVSTDRITTGHRQNHGEPVSLARPNSNR